MDFTFMYPAGFKRNRNRLIQLLTNPWANFKYNNEQTLINIGSKNEMKMMYSIPAPNLSGKLSASKIFWWI